MFVNITAATACLLVFLVSYFPTTLPNIFPSGADLRMMSAKSVKVEPDSLASTTTPQQTSPMACLTSKSVLSLELA
jgi:hypothetical protein